MNGSVYSPFPSGNYTLSITNGAEDQRFAIQEETAGRNSQLRIYITKSGLLKSRIRIFSLYIHENKYLLSEVQKRVMNIDMFTYLPSC